MKSITILIAHVSALIIISFVSFSETTNANNDNSNNNNTGLTIDLHHLVLHPTSPQYNPSLSHSQRVAIALNRSSFNRRLAASSSQATPNITNPEGIYYLNYFIGNPRVPQSGNLDTGSDLIWTSCNSKVQPRTLLKCADTLCQSFPGRTCKGNTDCTYSATYGDQSSSKGSLFTGTIAFSRAGGPQIDNAVFGCGTKNSGSKGIVGLGGGPVSLVRQLGAKKLSVCLAAFDSGTSKLQLGGNAVVNAGGKDTVVVPLVLDSKMPTYYRVSVNKITVGNTTLKLTGKTVIDTGTTKTMFPEPFYTNFRNAVIASVNNNKTIVTAPDGLESDLCYSVAPSNFNGITVGFEKSAQVLMLKPENIFLQFDDNLWCLVAGKSTIAPDSIFGTAALTNFNVGLDLEKNTATFQPQNCGGK